ncbi:hypothetical protein Ocin01_02796, partial [Orchesella cincta]
RGTSTTSHHHHQHHRRPPNTAELHAAIKIRNLPIRSSDTSLKDGLYHAYKKHGKVAWVRVIGSGADRYAIVCFKSQEYAAKAVQSSQDKQFFGCKIQVTPYYTGKGEESVGGTDEESRGPGEEESSFPTRTVLITSLDSSVTVSELKSAFDQYGDIVVSIPQTSKDIGNNNFERAWEEHTVYCNLGLVFVVLQNIDIRKQGSSTHAVCEFLDIASAIRAKWGRHVFKSREARISFFRNPPTNALLLDGTAGVTEKQVMSHCCQYGAIKRVDMDPERFLALVQYEEISSAETAIRELGNWAIKGKKLDIDFASQEVIRRYLERLDPGLSNSSLSICGSSSPSSNPIAALNAGVFKDAASRKARSRLGEYLGDEDGVKSGYNSYRYNDDAFLNYKENSKVLGCIVLMFFYYGLIRNELDNDSKPMTTVKLLDESSPPSTLNASRILSGREPHENLNSTVDHHGYKRLEHSTDSQRNAAVCTKSGGKERTEKFSSSGSIKIDLSCHETDSAIVTSSSDIIAVENSDTDVHSNFTGSSASGDEKVGSFEPATKHRKSSSENVSSILTTTTVDGVSSTSPEPKSEIVSTSADPGVGIGTDSVARYLNDAVATDSQKRVVDCKIRRTSADSGNHLNSSPESNVLHSNQDNESVPSSKSVVNNSKKSELVRPPTAVASNSQGTEDSDDRPGTPLCDENPEGFDAPALSSPSLKSDSATPPPRSKPEPTTPSEVPKAAVVVKTPSTIPVKDPKSSSSSSSCSGNTAKKVVSPTISPSSGASSSVMLSSTNDTSIFSPFNESPEIPTYSRSSTNVFENSNTPSQCNVKKDRADDIISCVGGGGAVSSEPIIITEQVTSVQEVKAKSEVVENDESASGTGFSSDSEGGLSPRHSPTADSLEQRVKNLCEKYDTWDGNRKILKHTPVSHSPLLSNSSSQDVNGSSSSSKPDSLIDKIKQTIPHFTGPSDIGRTVLAKKTIFDEDCERLVNYSEKYETKPSALLTTTTNWKLPTLSRSASCSSTSSAQFLGQTSPLAVVSSNCLPPLSSPVCISPVSGSFNGTSSSSSSKPHTPIVSSPSYSPSLSSAIVGKNAPEKVKDLNANVTPQLNRSIGQVVQKSFSIPSSNKPSTLSSLGVPSCSGSTKLSTSPPSLPITVKALNDTLTTASTSAGVTKPEQPPLHPPLLSPHGIRVERSLSLESRKNSPAVPSGFQSSFPSSGPSLPDTPVSSDSSRTVTPRRISVEPTSSAVTSLDAKLNLQISNEKSSDAPPPPPPSETTREKPAMKAVNPMNTLTSKKSELSSLKDEISAKVQPVHQETTVAVVATVQTPLLTSRNEVINTSSSKESSKKDKDKKRRSSGGSTPVSSGGAAGGGGHQSGPSNMKSDSHSNQGGSTSSSRSSKDKEERSSRKEKESKGDTSTKSGESSKNEESHHSSGGSSSHHKKEKRDKEKEHRDNSGDRASFSTSMSKDSHSHKRDRDNKESSKAKRRLSSQENDQERKKPKVDKEPEQSGHHHHRSSKGSESKDSRESAKDSSSISKDKLSSKDRSEKESSSKPEKTSSSSGSSSGPAKESLSNAEPKREKSDGRERDHHHKSKSSSSSSSSKHHSSSSHHQVQKSRSSTDGHSSSSTHKQDSSMTKDSSYKKDKEKEKEKFSGKENSASSSSSKSLSKHHSHVSSHSGSSSSKSKEGTSSSKSNKSSRKDRDKPKQEQRHPSSLDSDADGENNDAQKEHSTSSSHLEHSSERRSESKSERSEKRDSEGKRDRHKSGGGDSLSGMGGGDSDKSKSRKKEPKKRRRLVVEDSGSSDSDGPVNLLDDETEEEKKHHSIFDVVIDYSDYYVSMYDKVKRSNRACKNNTAAQKQQEEEKRKLEKVSESFKQLKQSRAKREEKKRSTSIEERKSMSNSSSDEGSHIDPMNEFDLEQHHRRHLESRQQLGSDKAQSSDDEERAKSSMSSSTKSKSKRKMKNKSSRKDDEKSRKRAKRSNKSPSRPNIYSSSTLFSHSDDDSQGSSTHPPDQKKKKLSSSSIGRHPISSLASSNNLSFSGSTKSSDESHSEAENSERKKMSASSMSSSSKPSTKPYVSFSDQLSNHQSKYNAHNIYSDSDSSDAERGEQNVLHKTPPPPPPPPQTPTQPPVQVHSVSVPQPQQQQQPHKTKLKEKSTKQKSRKQPLFDSTDSSENENEPVAQPVNKEKKSKDKEREPGREKSNKSRDRDKENKNKKRHRSHKSSSLKSRKQYYIPGEASGDGASHNLEKRESGATMEELFGPMTSSSDSDDARESDHERPKTPTVVLTTPSSCDDSVVGKKPKSTRHHSEKSERFSISSRHSESHSVDADESEISTAHHAHPAPPQPQSSASALTKSPEKKKKKHHKEKRSKRSSTHEGTPLSSQSSFAKQESSKSKPESVDYDALFNSPAASPVSELKIDSDYVPSDKAPSLSPTLPKNKETAVVLVPPVPDIAIRAPTPTPLPPPTPTPVLVLKPDPEIIDQCEKEMRGMFSSDDDEDDEKLKITDAITDAIRASADEQDIVVETTREIKEEMDPEWKRKEEEEKKLSCLVEQDKAIESIVLLERKSPPPPSTNPEDEVVKDDIPKDSATISQEETDVAVATILETLGVDEEVDDGADGLPTTVSEAKPLIVVAPTLPVPALSPPTLRIVEDAPKPVETSEAIDETASAVATIPPPDNVDDTKDEDRDEPDPWTYDDNRSPKELQIDEGDDVEEVREEEPQPPPVPAVVPAVEKPVVLNIPRTPTPPAKVQPPAPFEEVSVDAAAETTTTTIKNKVEAAKIPDIPDVPVKISLPTYKKESSSKAGDIYEFHDSDDDKSEKRSEKRSEKSHITHTTRHTPPMISPPAKSPVVQAPPPPVVVAAAPEIKIPSPPVSLPMPVLQPQQPPPLPSAEPEKPPSILLVSQPPPPPVVVQLPPPPPVVQLPPPPPVVVSVPIPTPTAPTTTIPVVVPMQVPPPPPVPVTTIPTSVPSSVISGLVHLPPPPIVTQVSSAVASVVSSVVSSMVANMEAAPVSVSAVQSSSTPLPLTPPSASAKSTPPPPPVATRSTIDEAIDEVIRKLHNGDLPFAESPMPAPVAQPAQRAGRRSRSRSKDSPDENASVTRMVNRPEPQRHGSNQVLGVIGGHQVDTQVPKVGKFGNSELDPNKTTTTTKDPNKLETLIDPQTGILTPMLHSDEGQYVPIMGQPNDPQGRILQAGMHQMPQINMANRHTPTVISRIMERDPMTTRASILEKHTPLLPHQQIPMTKHEGLSAMLAQQQRKSNEPPTTFAFQPQGSPIRAHMALSNAPSIMQPSVSQPPPLSSVGGAILRAVNVSYAMPVSHHSKVTTVVSSIGNPSPTGIPNNNNQGPPQGSFQPGHPPGSRGVFVATGVPSGVFQHQQPQILQLTTNKPPERQSPRPSSRHTPGPGPVVQTPTSQGGKPELVHLPEIPMATTVTKINAGEEQQRKSAIMQNMPNVVLTSTPGSIPTGPPYLIRTVVSSPSSQIPMTQQQIQQHRTLQEAFLRSAGEGGIRLTTGKDDLNEHGPRPNELMHGATLHPPAHSPKPGRVPMPHEQLPAHTNQQQQQRGIPQQHRPQYETPGADMRLIPGHARLTSEGPHYGQPEHPSSFSPHYISANIPNHVIGHQPPTFQLRHDKPGMPSDGKVQQMITNDPKGPAIITVVERPPSHNVPPHLSSPHGNEQRSADSPSIGAVFPGQRQLYQTSGLPQQQHPTSQVISNMYAELDGRPFAHSPSYMQYDSRAISVAAAAAAAMEQERERPKGTSSPMDPPYRLSRSPPSSLNSGEAGLQGDSLLLLLQRYPIMWQGLLALKNDSAAVQMHFVSGSMNVARDSLPSHPDGSIPPLRISQRMRLEPNQLDGVARKLQINAEHCMLLALPCGRDHMDVLHQSNNLRQGFITYLQLKQAAGIVNICHPDTQQAAYVIHIFPSCDFANENLAKIAPDLLSGVADIAHLLIVIATV